MNKVKFFIDETNAIVTEKGWKDVIDLSWLSEENISGVFGIESIIGSFVKIFNLGELPVEKVKENFEILRGFIDDVKRENFKEILGMRYDPRLYMSDKELIGFLCDKLESKLNKNERAMMESNELSQFMDMLAAISNVQGPRLHQYAKRKKLKK